MKLMNEINFQSILDVITQATIDRGYALSSSEASAVLRMHDIFIPKKFKYDENLGFSRQTTLSEFLNEIHGITVVPAHYHGGRTTIVVDALADIDPDFSASFSVENSRENTDQLTLF